MDVVLIATEADLDAALLNHDPYLWVDGSAEMDLCSEKTLDYPVTVHGGRYHVADGPAFVVTHPDVTIAAAHVTGGARDTPTRSPAQKLIHVLGDPAAPIGNTAIYDCVFRDSRSDNIWLQWATEPMVSGCSIRNYLYSAVMGISTQHALVQGNSIGDAHLTSGTVDVYGIAFTDLDNTPAARSRNCSAVGNTLYRIDWEALDTHGGDGISFTGNTVIGCRRGIAFVTGNETRTLSPQRCLASGNLIDGTGAAPGGNGIWIAGMPYVPADGTITGNHITGYPAGAEFGGLTYVDRPNLYVGANNVPLQSWRPIQLGPDFKANTTFVPEYMIDGNTVTLRGMPIPINSDREIIGRLTNPHAWPDKLTFLGDTHGSGGDAAGRFGIGVWGTAEDSEQPPGTVQAFYPETPWSDTYSYPLFGSFQAA